MTLTVSVGMTNDWRSGSRGGEWEMSAVLKFDSLLEVHYCPNCAIQFAAPPRFIKERREDGKSFYCPSGHTMSFHETEIDKLKKQLQREKENTEWWKNTAASKDKTIKGQNIAIGKVKAKLHRTETRVSHGICPCCNRSFVNMQRHMKTKHPDYVKEHSPNEPTR